MKVDMRHSDIFVSICFDDWKPTPECIAVLENVSNLIDRDFRYWEVIVAVPEFAIDAPEDVLDRVRNLRILKLRGEYPMTYQRREIVASEAIGDVVVIASMEEVAHLDLPAMITRAHGQSSIVGVARSQNGLLSPLIMGLGRMSGFRVDAGLMRTVAMPKGILDMLLRHTSPQIALRFPPLSSDFPVELVRDQTNVPPLRLRSDVKQKVFVLQCLLSNSAPMILQYVTYLSGLIVVGAVMFAIYAVAVSLIKETAEGWLTISLALSGTAGFLGIASAGLSAGLKRVIELLTPTYDNALVNEIGSMELFDEVSRELNVETTAEQSR